MKFILRTIYFPNFASMKKHIFPFCILLLCATVLTESCNKKEDNLFSISISPNTMIGTPAENFSLQQIKMFQISNDFVCKMIPEIINGGYTDNFFIAPVYFINNILSDTASMEWQKAFAEHYGMQLLSYNQRAINEKNFLRTVKEIDSSFNITSTPVFNADSVINITQNFCISFPYRNIIKDDIDNIFTSYNNNKQRTDFVTINDNIRAFIDVNVRITEFPVGNGNYMLMLIRPEDKSITEFAKEFTEKSFVNAVNKLQERRINVSFPVINVSSFLPNTFMPEYTEEENTINFPKQVNLSSFFTTSATDISQTEDINATDLNYNMLQSTDTQPLKFNTPFMFIVRGKNSNLIMLIGIFCNSEQNKVAP